MHLVADTEDLGFCIVYNQGLFGDHYYPFADGYILKGESE